MTTQTMKELINHEFGILRIQVQLINSRTNDNRSDVAAKLIINLENSKLDNANLEWQYAWLIENCMNNMASGSDGFARNLVDIDNLIHPFARFCGLVEDDLGYNELYDLLDDALEEYSLKI